MSARLPLDFLPLVDAMKHNAREQWKRNQKVYARAGWDVEPIDRVDVDPTVKRGFDLLVQSEVEHYADLTCLSVFAFWAGWLGTALCPELDYQGAILERESLYVHGELKTRWRLNIRLNQGFCVDDRDIPGIEAVKDPRVALCMWVQVAWAKQQFKDAAAG